MRQICDLGVKVIVVRPGIGTSENVNKTRKHTPILKQLQQIFYKGF